MWRWRNRRYFTTPVSRSFLTREPASSLLAGSGSPFPSSTFPAVFLSRPPPNGRNVRQRENVGFFDLAPLLDRGSEATSGGETPVPAVGAGGVGFPRGIGFGGDASVGGKSAVAGFFGANSARGPALFVFPRLSRHSHHPAQK